MIFWILAALLTAAATIVIIVPLGRKNRLTAVLLTFALPISALIVYFLRGASYLLK